MNSEEEQEELNEEQGQRENGPGHLLVKKREALGIEVQEVADALHITMHYVRALETDAHDKLPGDVFIKGYLRAYANFLQLDPSVIINVYLDYSSQQADADSQSSTRRRNSKRTPPWLVVSAVAFVGMAVALWFFSTSNASSNPSPARSTGTGAAASTPVVTTRTLRTAVAATLDEVATSVEVPSVPEQLARPEPSAALDTRLAPDSASSLEMPVPVEEDAEAAEVIQDPASARANDAAAQEAPSAEHLFSVDGGGADLVQFTFTGQSMVQVVDANDEQLYRAVRVAGDSLRISGTAPFNILLGDASNSELSFNGTKVDFSSSIRIDNSARLTIGL